MTDVTHEVLFPEEFFSAPQTSSGIQSQFELLTLEPGPVSSGVQSNPSPLGTSQVGLGLHSFTIIAKMLTDSRLTPDKTRKGDSPTPFVDTMQNVGTVIREYARQWIVPSDGDIQGLSEKIEELQWLATLLFGLGGWKEGHKFRSDFFLCA